MDTPLVFIGTKPSEENLLTSFTKGHLITQPECVSAGIMAGDQYACSLLRHLSEQSFCRVQYLVKLLRLINENF
jgi:hypothetical protein